MKNYYHNPHSLMNPSTGLHGEEIEMCKNAVGKTIAQIKTLIGKCDDESEPRNRYHNDTLHEWCACPKDLTVCSIRFDYIDQKSTNHSKNNDSLNFRRCLHLVMDKDICVFASTSSAWMESGYPYFDFIKDLDENPNPDKRTWADLANGVKFP